MPEPRAAIVVINYQDWRNCQRCLHSLSDLDYRNFSVVLVANAAPPEPPPPFPRLLDITVLRNPENLGFATACNQGIRAAARSKPEFIWLLNNDAVADPAALAALIEETQIDSRIGAAGSVLLHDDAEHSIQVWGGGAVSTRSGLPRHLTRGMSSALQYVCGASMLLRSRALEEVGLLDEGYFMYWEDTELSFRLRRSGWKLVVAERSRVTHLGDFSSRFQSEFFDYHFTASSIRFFRQHCRFWPLPVGVSVAGRFLRRTFAGRWGNARAALSGCRDSLWPKPGNRCRY